MCQAVWDYCESEMFHQFVFLVIYHERMYRCLIVRPVVPLSSVLNNKRIVLGKVLRNNHLTVNQLLLFVSQERWLLLRYKVMPLQWDEGLEEVVAKTIRLVNNCFQACQQKPMPCKRSHPPTARQRQRSACPSAGQLTLQCTHLPSEHSGMAGLHINAAKRCLQFISPL